jgi:V8-like Glu-specific endopeptidase
MKRFAFGLLLAAGACTARAPVGSTEQRIIGGTSDPGDPAVVMLDIHSPSKGQLICTGSVVSPHVVLTAGHCVHPQLVGATATFRVFLGETFGAIGTSSQLVAVQETHPSPNYSPGFESGGSDVAVAITETPIAVTPLPFNKNDLDPALAGDPVRFVGYGVSAGNDTNGITAGTRRQVTAPLGAVRPALLEFDTANRGTCEGDSGGPALMKLDGMTETIVGVTSFGINLNCAPPGFDSRVDIEGDFVQMYIDQFDPPPPPDMALGPNGFVPGAIGATCGADTDCNPGLSCANPGPDGTCTTACDPAASICPDRTHCDQNQCVRDSASAPGGCTYAGGRGTAVGAGDRGATNAGSGGLALSGAALAALLVLLLAAARRRAR